MIHLQQDCEKYSDNDLVLLAIKNPDIYSCLVLRYEEKLKRYIFRISDFEQMEVEDVLQDIFLKTYLNLNDFDERLQFSSWIYRITHNEVVNNHRKRISRKLDKTTTLEDWHEVASDISAELDMDKILDREVIQKVFDKMDHKYKEILILRFLEDKDYSEISDILRRPMGTIATMLSRAKKQFKKIIIIEGINL